MSREIKFRFWDTRFQRFEPAGYMFGPEGPQFPADKVIPQQYTGLKDKNGVEIYESDVVKLDDVITGSVGLNPGFVFGEDDKLIIQWDNSIAAWSFDYSGDDSKDRVDIAYRNQARSLIIDGQCEVIGNVMENPELLK